MWQNKQIWCETFQRKKTISLPSLCGYRRHVVPIYVSSGKQRDFILAGKKNIFQSNKGVHVSLPFTPKEQDRLHTSLSVALANAWIIKTSQCKTCYYFTLLLNPSRPNPGRTEEIKLNFYFQTSLWCLKRFYEGFKAIKGLHKTFWDTTKKFENKNLT